MAGTSCPGCLCSCCTHTVTAAGRLCHGRSRTLALKLPSCRQACHQQGPSCRGSSISPEAPPAPPADQPHRAPVPPEGQPSQSAQGSALFCRNTGAATLPPSAVGGTQLGNILAAQRGVLGISAQGLAECAGVHTVSPLPTPDPPGHFEGTGPDGGLLGGPVRILGVAKDTCP